MTENAKLARSVCEILSSRKLTLSVAESCTGGALCTVLTGVTDCEQPLTHGFVTYTKEAKSQALAIPEKLLDEHGVISPECAKAMADGARKVARADYGLGITGVAGPETSEGKPVGLVFLACAGVGETIVKRFEFGNLDREAIRKKCVTEGLKLIQNLASS